MVKKTLIFFRSTALVLGLLFAWTSRQSANPDAICYLDLSDAFRHGQWHHMINAIWCPLYPALLGFTSFLLKPSAYWEMPMVHLVNFGVYGCALLSFEFLLAELRTRRDALALSESSWIAVCYTAFLYGVISLIQLMTVTPDLCVAAVVFFAAGLITRIQHGDHRWRIFIVLGLVLGIGYWAKTIMFFLGYLFLAMAAWVARSQKGILSKSLAGVIAFWVTISLFIIPLSLSKHRFTFGDVGRMRYAWQILDLSDFPLHPEGIAGHGIPVHACHLLMKDPFLYEFGSHIAGTYSLAFDMSYWFEGLTYQVDPWKQLPIVVKSMKVYFDIFSVEWSLFLGIVLLYAIRRRRPRGRAGWRSFYPLIGLSLGALAVFSLMEAEGRYVGAYVALLIIGIISSVRVPETMRTSRWTQGMVLLMLLGPAVNLLHASGSVIKFEWQFDHGVVTPPCAMHWQIAEALQRAGLKENDWVANLGPSYGAYWARLGKNHIVAETITGAEFWKAPAAAQHQAFTILKRMGVQAVVGMRKAGIDCPVGWKPVGQTNYAIAVLNENPS